MTRNHKFLVYLDWEKFGHCLKFSYLFVIRIYVGYTVWFIPYFLYFTFISSLNYLHVAVVSNLCHYEVFLYYFIFDSFQITFLVLSMASFFFFFEWINLKGYIWPMFVLIQNSKIIDTTISHTWEGSIWS